MRLAIVSQGLSARLYTGQRYDAVIGVNAMARRWPCEFWSFNDAATFKNVTPIGQPVVWCKAAAVSDLADSDPAALARLQGGPPVRLHESSGLSLYTLEPRWNLFSGLAAMGLALILLPTQLDLYGYDMSGELDALGVTHAVRSEERWRVEQELFDRLLQLAHQRGIVVRRVTH